MNWTARRRVRCIDACNSSSAFNRSSGVVDVVSADRMAHRRASDLETVPVARQALETPDSLLVERVRGADHGGSREAATVCVSESVSSCSI